MLRTESSNEATVVAWDRGEAGLTSIHNFMERYSRQHIVSPPSAPRTLCGSRWPAAYETAGDSRKCERCFKIAAKRGLVDQFGQLLGADA